MITPRYSICIIIPILNEADNLPQLLTHIAKLNPSPQQIIMVDGGSTDNSVSIAQKAITDLLLNNQTAIDWQLIESAAGRAVQMNIGAATATSDTLLFLHADTQLPNNAMTEIEQVSTEYDWGRFDVRLDSRKPLLWLVSTMMNSRSRLTKIATGDQAIFIKKSLFEHIGGYPKQPLMEDIELCKILKGNAAKPARLKTKVITSARRWQQYGTWRTIFLMWHLRFDYWRGVSAESIKQRYYKN